MQIAVQRSMKVNSKPSGTIYNTEDALLALKLLPSSLPQFWLNIKMQVVLKNAFLNRHLLWFVWCTGAQIFRECGSHFKMQGTVQMSHSESHAKDPQTLGTIVQNIVTTVTWCLGFEHLWPNVRPSNHDFQGNVLLL
jgi:hypothetical protein